MLGITNEPPIAGEHKGSYFGRRRLLPYKSHTSAIVPFAVPTCHRKVFCALFFKKALLPSLMGFRPGFAGAGFHHQGH
jgi:hypothetical protein